MDVKSGIHRHGIRNPQRGIRNPRLSWITLHGAKLPFSCERLQTFDCERLPAAVIKLGVKKQPGSCKEALSLQSVETVASDMSR